MGSMNPAVFSMRRAARAKGKGRNQATNVQKKSKTIVYNFGFSSYQIFPSIPASTRKRKNDEEEEEEEVPVDSHIYTLLLFHTFTLRCVCAVVVYLVVVVGKNKMPSSCALLLHFTAGQ